MDLKMHIMQGLQKGFLRQTTMKLTSSYGSPAFMVISAVELSNIEGARKIAFDKDFISTNQAFVNSGEITELAVIKGFHEFARELMEAGYVLKENTLLKAIKKGELKAISNTISGGFYPKSGFQLEYWYLLYKNFEPYAHALRSLEPELDNLGITEMNYNHQTELLEKALKSALERGLDDIACIILKLNPQVVSSEMIDIALDFNNIEFLRRIWTGSKEDNHAFARIKRLKISAIWSALNSKTNDFKRYEASKLMKISYIVKFLLEKELITEARKVITWPDAADDSEILRVCVEMGEEEIGRDVILNRKQEVLEGDFVYCLEQKCYWLALDMLKWNKPVAYLITKEAQKNILELLKNGYTCYMASEMLSVIEPGFWYSDLTEGLCENVGVMLEKTMEFVKCPHPILYLTLMAEFLLKIAPVNLYFSNICKKLSKDILSLAKIIEDCITEESELVYFLCCSDIRGRTALTIIAENNFSELLENNDVGSIVNNLWIGNRKNEGIIMASSLCSSFFAPEGSEEKLLFLDKMDHTKAYMFQYEQLVSSCKMRFFSQMMSVVLLVFFYTMMMYMAQEHNSLSDFAASSESAGWLRLSQVWIIGILLEKFLLWLFCKITKRKLILDFWYGIDIFMFIMMIFLMASINEYYTGPNKWLYFVGPSDFNTLMHAVVLCLVWLKLFNILMITESYGPLLRIMYLMAVDMMIFLLVYFGALFIGAVILTCIFYNVNPNFISFGMSIQTLYSMSLGSFDLTLFTSYTALGGILESIGVLVTSILLFNILIGLLTITYEREREGEESKYRTTLIKAYYKWRWDEDYGILILLPSPITIFTTLILPVLFGVNKAERVTGLFSRIFFILFVLPMFAYFAAVSAIFIPIIYLTALDNFAKGGTKKITEVKILDSEHSEDSDVGDDDDEMVENGQIADSAPKIRTFSCRRAVIWVIAGLGITIYAYFRDLIDFWRLIFKASKTRYSGDEDDIDITTNDIFITNLLNSLESFESDEISAADLIDKYIEIDSKMLSPMMIANEELMSKRSQSITDFIELLPLSKKLGIINKLDILEMLPRRNYYSEPYILRAKHIRIQWLSKSLKTYKKEISSFNIKGIEIPSFLVRNETFQVKRVLNTAKAAKRSSNLLVTNLNLVEAELQKK